MTAEQRPYASLLDLVFGDDPMPVLEARARELLPGYQAVVVLLRGIMVDVTPEPDRSRTSLAVPAS